MAKQLTGSPSFDNLFDANGHVKSETDEEQLTQTTTHTVQTAQTAQMGETTANPERASTSTSSPRTATTATTTTTTATTTTAMTTSSTRAGRQPLRRGAPQSISGGDFMATSTLNNTGRPSSSYSKTRKGYDPNSKAQQLNLTPGKDHITELQALDIQDTNVAIPSTTNSTSTLDPHTPRTATTTLRTPLEATDNISPPAVRSSLYLPETPPAPQAMHCVLEDREHITQLSLQPHIHDTRPATPLSFKPISAPSIRKSDKSPLLFSSVPQDALHSIAGFLTAQEWCNLALVSKEAHVACREVFKKVKMHGFKCAVEIISAWEFGEHGDARELAALYLKSGVPIYPAPFGHAYHTVNWRMKMEVKEMNLSPNSENQEGDNQQNTTNNDTNHDNDNDTPSEPKPDAETVDKFYSDRIEARTSEYNSSLTYLEEKGIFWRNAYYTSKGIVPEITRNAQYQPPRVNIRPIPPPLPAGFGFFAFFDEDEEDANFNHIMEQGRIIGIGENVVVEPGNEHLLHIEFGRVPQRENEVVRSTTVRRGSSSSLKRASSKLKGLYVPVKCHRHLADQHVHRQAAINDEKGTMIGGDLSLSADFFHPVERRKVFMFPSATRSEGNASKTPITEHYVISNLDIQVYSSETNSIHIDHAQQDFQNAHGYNVDTDRKQKALFREVVQKYERLMSSFLERGDYAAFDECMLDLWDEYYTVTATVHYYDKFTPVPRISHKRRFLSRPCPKAFGTVQCEIERVNVTGRLFPTYEYRLFIRDRRRPPQFDGPPQDEEIYPRVDTLLMTGKHRSRTYSGFTNGGYKRGVNNYHFHMPQQSDIDDHLNSVNESIDMKSALKGFKQREAPGSHLELGRLQSNFIGTEFQIFSPSHDMHSSSSTGSNDLTKNKPLDNQDVPKTEKSKKRKSLLRIPRRMRRHSSHQCEVNHTNNDLRNRKGRITPWSSFTKKSISRYSTSDHTATDREIGAITYTANLLGNRPRVMDVCIPKIDDETGLSVPFGLCGESGEDCNILSNLKTSNQQNNTIQDDEVEDLTQAAENLDNLGLLSLQNRPPWWNVELGAFVLNFGGRVSVASVKNFQLCDRNDHDNIMLQFGRIEGRHSFTMDFSYPLSPLQAFAIAVSSLQSKITFA